MRFIQPFETKEKKTMTSELQTLVKESDLYDYAIRGKVDAFSKDFNRRLIHAVTTQAHQVLDFLRAVLKDGSVRVFMDSVISIYEDLVRQAEIQLMFVR